ncbi:hypothetical protein E8E13_004361 [Curvularia kusanoi]|uniref:INO80 complex subunit F domain-containing protein n=1 Tax=Curvularia kusanoi TaxID=90978 RepID=A0A9P4T6R7_CURKU|nr:hypothetical protein E8E13_004361 [Curvularia kusanoi]
MPQPAARAFSQKDLPPSVEAAYYRKCIELRRRINDIEENNDGTRQRIQRLNRGIQKMRLERAFLLDQLQKHQEYSLDDSERSSSVPPTPTDKPLRSKRSHRKGTPPTTTSGAVPDSAARQPRATSPGEHGSTHLAISHTHAINPLSSAQSTPDPSRHTNPFFSSVGAGASASPNAAVTNGTQPGALPPLHSLPGMSQQQPAAPTPQTQQTPTPRPYFDPAYDAEQRPADAEPTRPRAYSGAAQQQQAPPQHAASPQNGDTEMRDAGFPAAANTNQ